MKTLCLIWFRFCRIVNIIDSVHAWALDPDGFWEVWRSGRSSDA